ncbi:hypothetical protein [Limnohabitans sp.]|uniref:hypothetical protein n=1 Tax=Limnohabitans sp. TaxID=1907725 RepID=UPI002AFF5C57|nr:hypothetical protein [Limnohabitans sp.]
MLEIEPLKVSEVCVIRKLSEPLKISSAFDKLMTILEMENLALVTELFRSGKLEPHSSILPLGNRPIPK